MGNVEEIKSEDILAPDALSFKILPQISCHSKIVRKVRYKTVGVPFQYSCDFEDPP